MIPFGQIVSEVEANLRKHGATDLASIRRSLNLVLREFVVKHPFAAYRRSRTFDFSTGTDSTDNAHILPSNLAVIFSVWDTANSREFHYSSQGYATGETQNYSPASDPRYRYYYADPVSVPLYFERTVTIEDGSTTFVCSGWDAAWIGEFCMFGSGLGIYEITDTRTISPKYRGDHLLSKYITVRPAGTKRFALVDKINAASTAIVNVAYTQFPHPLTADEDIIPLPTSRALELATMIKIVGEKDKKRLQGQSWQEELPFAWADLVASDPAMHSPRPPIDRTGFGVNFR